MKQDHDVTASQPNSSGRTSIIVVLLLLVVGVVLFTQNSQLSASSLPHISGTDWWWVALAGAGVITSFACSAAVLIGLSPIRLDPKVSYIAQIAAAGSKVIAPAATGVIGLNARFMMKNGQSLTGALTTVAATQVAQLGLTAVLVAALLPVVGGIPKIKVPEGPGYAIAAAGCIAAIGVYFLIRRRKNRARSPGELSPKQQLKVSLRSLVGAVRSPRRLVLIVGGSLALTASLAVCMWSSVIAVGGTISYTTAAVVMMVGAALGSLFPTPGGIGGVEGSMVAVFLAAGQPLEIAIPAVLLFRLMSFWVPGPFGALAGWWLNRKGYL